MILVIDPEVGVLPLGAVTTASVSRSVTVAKHPMESGTPTTDNAEPSNATVVLACRVSEAATTRQANRSFSEYANVGNADVLVGKTGIDRVHATIDFLRSVEGKLVDVVSTEGRFIYTDMLLTQYPHEWSIVRSSPFTLSFVEPRIVETGSARIPPHRRVPGTITDEDPEAESGTVNPVGRRDVSVEKKLRDAGLADIVPDAVLSFITGGD